MALDSRATQFPKRTVMKNFLDFAHWPFMNRALDMRVRNKLLVSLAALMVPVLLLAFLLGLRSFEEIRFVRKEEAGMAFQKPFAEAVRAVVSHRRSMRLANDANMLGLASASE